MGFYQSFINELMKRIDMLRVVFLFTMLTLFVEVVQSQSIDDVESGLLELSIAELMNIEITTATKTSSKLDLAPGIVDVITADQIAQRGYQNLAQLLNDIANNHQDRANWGIGEPISQNVGFGFRFDTGQNILLLFNGQRLNAFLPGNRFGGEEYLLGNIERIEIIRGPGSALYGTGAFTAVVNIISRKIPETSRDELSTGVSYMPTSGGIIYNAAILTRIGNLGSLNSAFRYSYENGQSLNVANSLFGNTTLRDGVNYTYDGEIILSIKDFNVLTKFSKQSRNTFTGFNAVNPSNLDELELYMHAYSVGFDYSKTFGKSTIKIMGGWHQDNWTEVALVPIFKPQDDPDAPQELDIVNLFRGGENIMTSFFIDGQGADTRSIDGEVQLTISYAKNNNIVVGIYAANDKVIDAVRPSELNLDPLQFFPFREIRDPKNNWLFDLNASRQTIAGYLQADYNVTSKLSLSVGARWDNYSGTGELKSQQYSEFNPKAALVYADENLGTFKLLAGSATRIPNGFETLSSVSILGNPNNTPERIQTYQVQWIRNWTSKFRTELGYFRSSISNRLETNANISEQLKANGYVGQFVNVGDGIVQSNNGFDWRMAAKIYKTTLNVNMTQYFKSNNGFGESIAYMPNTMVNIDYLIPISWISFNVGGNYRGDFKKPVTDQRKTVANYLVSRLTIIMDPPGIPFQFFLGAKNLLNTKYEYPASSQDFTNHFPARGIDLIVGIAYKPKFNLPN
jgi:outer membrane receptor for ferrienterochelin and colicin